MASYTDEYDEEDYVIARRRVKEKKGFYWSFASYVVVISFLFLINVFTDPRYLWFLWPAIGWGIGIVFQGLRVYGRSATGSDWEERELKKELKRRRKQRGQQSALPPPRPDLLSDTERVRERLRPKVVREDYDEDEFV